MFYSILISTLKFHWRDSSEYRKKNELEKKMFERLNWIAFSCYCYSWPPKLDITKRKTFFFFIELHCCVRVEGPLWWKLIFVLRRKIRESYEWVAKCYKYSKMIPVCVVKVMCCNICTIDVFLLYSYTSATHRFILQFNNTVTQHFYINWSISKLAFCFSCLSVVKVMHSCCVSDIEQLKRWSINDVLLLYNIRPVHKNGFVEKSA